MTQQSDETKRTGRRHGRQIHFWVSDREYEQLQSRARRNGETISAFVRRVLRSTELVKDAAADAQASGYFVRSSLHKK